MLYAKKYSIAFFVILLFLITGLTSASAQEKRESSYTSVIEEPFDKVVAQDKAQKADVMKRHMDLLTND